MEDDTINNPSQLEAHAKFLEEIRTEEPVRSCDMVRAWMKLNIEASMCPVWNN
jgi:hypothetical protein